MGFFSALFKGKKQTVAGALAMPLFPHPQRVDYERALAWLREHFADSPRLEDPSRDEESCTVGIPGGQLGFVHIPAPVPRGDLEWPLENAWYWREAPAVIEAHQSHVVCFANSAKLDMIDMRLLHSRVVAALLAVGEGSAVYIGDARLVKPAAGYIEEIMSGSRESLPLMAWVGFHPVREGAAHSAFTTGLTEFGLLELEARNSRLPWPRLLETLANIAHYQIVSGQQIEDGDTVGESETDLRKVRHTTSRFLPKTRVAVIES